MKTRHLWFALLGILVLAAVSLVMIVSTSPQAGAATTRPASIYPADEVRTGCWAVDPPAGWAWSQASQIYNSHNGNDCYNGAGSFYFVLAPCAPAPNQGYCSMTEVHVNGLTGIVSSTGYCGGWSNALQRIVKQTCGNYTYQGWAGTGTRPDLIWNWWVQINYPHVCPIAGGYTQQVITSDADNGAVYLACPRGAGGQSYTPAQEWYLIEPIS